MTAITLHRRLSNRQIVILLGKAAWNDHSGTMDDAALANFGMTFLNPRLVTASMAHLPQPRTLILTGLSGSGASMLAQAVQAAGVFIGAAVDDVVQEDADIGAALVERNALALGTIITSRNVGHKVWAFKRRDLHLATSPQTIARFRNPQVVVMIRDIAAVAQRLVVSERLSAWAAVDAAMTNLQGQMAFLRQLTCPVMLISYEKAVMAPDAFVTGLAGFISGTVTAAQLQAMRLAVEPNRLAYGKAAQRRYDGVIDYVRDGILSGWARELGSAAPVELTLMLDGKAMLRLKADQMRPDLAALGGDGRHGFAVNVRPFMRRLNAVVSIYVAGRTVELRNSSRKLGQLIMP